MSDNDVREYIYNIRDNIGKAILVMVAATVLPLYAISLCVDDVNKFFSKKSPSIIFSVDSTYEQEFKQAQAHLDDLLAHHGYEDKCDMSNQDQVEDAIDFLEDKYDIEIENPIRYNRKIKKWAKKLSEDEVTELEKAFKIYSEIIENVNYTVRNQYSPIQIFDEFEKTGKFSADCDTLTNFYVAALRSIGIEAYAVEVIVDEEGKKIENKLFRGSKGWEHICPIIRTKDGKAIQAELAFGKKGKGTNKDDIVLTSFYYFGIENRKIEIRNDLENMLKYYHHLKKH